MELNTILELVKAGFTKDEIMQMEQPTQTAPVQTPVEEQNTNPTTVQLQMDLPTQTLQSAPAQVVEPVAPAVPAPAPAPVPQPVQTPAQDQPTMADIMQGIAKLTSAVQANAIAQSVIPQGLQTPPSAEDMLAEIIRPTFKERS